MSKNVTEKIKDKAFELLKDNPDGLRYFELVEFISENDEKLYRNTINGSILNLDSQFPEKVYKRMNFVSQLVLMVAVNFGHSRFSRLTDRLKKFLTLFVSCIRRWNIGQTSSLKNTCRKWKLR